MTRVPDERDAFLRELSELDLAADVAEGTVAEGTVAEGTVAEGTVMAELGLTVASEILEPIAPPPTLRDRLLSELAGQGRFERFAQRTAELLDIGLERARALLDRLDDAASWSRELPGVEFFWVDGGPAVANAVRGFVRVEAGLDFPEHEHLGDETVLVLQGRYLDPDYGREVGPGDIGRMPAGTSHAFHVPDDGPALLKLVVVQTGLRALGQTYLPR